MCDPSIFSVASLTSSLININNFSKKVKNSYTYKNKIKKNSTEGYGTPATYYKVGEP